MNPLIKGIGIFFVLIFITAPVLAQETTFPISFQRPDFSSPLPDYNKLSWVSDWTPISIVRTISSGFSNAFSEAQATMLRFPKEWVKNIPEDNPARAEEKLRGNLRDLLDERSAEEVPVNVIVFSDYLDEAAQKVQVHGAVLHNSFRIGNILSIRVPKNKLLDIAKIPEVKSIWPNRIFHTNLDSSVPQIHASSMWSAGYTGTGVKVAVLDTGINSTHPMLQGRVPIAQSFTGEPATDSTGHGTHVAGIIGGKLNGANTYNGVAPDATLWNIKVLDNTGHGDENWIIAGINYAVDPDNNPSTDDGADVLNLSFGGPYTSPNSPIVTAIESAIARGVVVVIASGNCGPGCPSGDCQGFVGVETPGDAPNAITVGAVDDASQWACFSSGGFVNNGLTLKPDVVAPGVNISSSSLNSSLATLSGTSMAAPHVSGMVALLLQSSPALTPQNVKDILEQTASDFGDPGKDSKYGSGLIDGSQLLPSSVLTLLKYSLSQSANVIDASNPISFTISSASNDVYSMELTVTRPNQLVDTISLTQNGLQWVGSFSATQLTGGYLVTATVENLAHDVTILHKTFSVKAPSTTGALLGHNVPVQVDYGQPLVVNAQFQNTGAFDTNVLLELQEWKEGYFERIFFSNATPVSVGQTVFIPVNWTPLSTLGNKTIKLVATFDDTALELDQNVWVEDPDPPIIWSVSHDSTSKTAQPITVDVRAGDLTALSGVIHLAGPVSQDVPLFTRFDSDFNRTLRGIVEPYQSGIYSVVVDVCDAATPAHCVSSAAQPIVVSSCTHPKSLIVLGGGSADDFNFLSPAQYCVGFWEDTHQSPSPAFLNSFPIVYWNAGTSYHGTVDENAALALSTYAGTLILDGDNIAFRHGNDSFIQTQGHASFVDKVTVDANNPSSIIQTYPHHLFNTLSTTLPLQSNTSFSADVLRADNNGTVLATYSNLSPAIVAYQEGLTQRRILFGFSTSHLSSSVRQTLIQNIFEWVGLPVHLELAVRLFTPFYIPSDTLSSGPGAKNVLIEGNNPIRLAVTNFGDQNVLAAPFDASVDGVFQQSKDVKINSGFSKAFTFDLNLLRGDHNLTVMGNPHYALLEPNTLNNKKTIPIWVAPVLPNLHVLRIEGDYNVNALQARVYVSNWGGTPVNNARVQFTVENQTYSTDVNLVPGGVTGVPFTHITSRQNLSVSATIDPFNTVIEDNEMDNSKTNTLYFCTKQNVLVVNDDDAEIYWASDEDFMGNVADLNASSAPSFEKILKENGYCTTVWNESTQGVPSSSVLNQFPLVIWSTGDYWSQVVDANDELVIRQYSGSILLEGNDIAFDHRDDNFSFDILRADMNRDVFSLSGIEQIALNNSIFPSLSTMDINFFYSSFADAVTPLNGSFSAGDWNAGKSALTLYSAPGSRTSFMSFALDSISSPSDQNTFLTTLVEWLLLAFNQPASTPTSLLCNGATCAGNYTNSIALACSGSTDPESDPVQYDLEASLASLSSNWGDGNWTYRTPIAITNQHQSFSISSSYTIPLSLDLNRLVSESKALPDGRDVRVVFEGQDLNRMILPAPAAYFNSSARLDAGNSSSLNVGGGEFTLEAWFNTSRSGSHQHIAGKRDATTPAWLRAFVYSTNNHAMCETGILDLDSGVAVNDGKWHHLACVRSGSTFKLFLDGVERASGTLSANLDNSGPFDIGYLGISGSNGFKGLIDEVRLSNTARYAATFVPSQNPFGNDALTKGLWHLDGSLNDSSSNGFNLSLTGGAVPFTEGAVIRNTAGNNTILFQTQQSIQAGQSDGNYIIYTGNPAASIPNTDPLFIWLADPSFSTGWSVDGAQSNKINLANGKLSYSNMEKEDDVIVHRPLASTPFWKMEYTWIDVGSPGEWYYLTGTTNDVSTTSGVNIATSNTHAVSSYWAGHAGNWIRGNPIDPNLEFASWNSYQRYYTTLFKDENGVHSRLYSDPARTQLVGSADTGNISFFDASRVFAFTAPNSPSLIAENGTGEIQDFRFTKYISSPPQVDVNVSALQTTGSAPAWSGIGSHAEGNAFNWNISSLGTQPVVGLRCRSIDYAGSGQYSTYYTADQNISIN